MNRRAPGLGRLEHVDRAEHVDGRVAAGSATERRTSIWAARWKTASGSKRSNDRSDRGAVADVELVQLGAPGQRAVEVRRLTGREVVDHRDARRRARSARRRGASR